MFAVKIMAQPISEGIYSSGDIAAVGTFAPDFVLDTEDGGNWRLSDHDGKVRVLLFYPQNETLVCTKQLCSVRDNWQDYLETKAEIVGISPSTPEQNIEFSQSRSLPIPLLADPGRDVTSLYGKHWLFPIQLTRAIVVIDAMGMIRSRRVMLRAFRPSDADVITSIYEARGDVLQAKYQSLTSRFRRIKSN